jgi:hypothetical protein
MSKTVYEVKVKTGTYQKDGQEKGRYEKIGSVIETRNGLMLKIDAIPVIDNGWSGWCYLNTPRPKDHGYKGLPQDEDDSVPF